MHPFQSWLALWLEVKVRVVHRRERVKSDADTAPGLVCRQRALSTSRSKGRFPKKDRRKSLNSHFGACILSKNAVFKSLVLIFIFYIYFKKKKIKKISIFLFPMKLVLLKEIRHRKQSLSQCISGNQNQVTSCNPLVDKPQQNLFPASPYTLFPSS